MRCLAKLVASVVNLPDDWLNRFSLAHIAYLGLGWPPWVILVADLPLWPAQLARAGAVGGPAILASLGGGRRPGPAP
jgi:hypothetical protein